MAVAGLGGGGGALWRAPELSAREISVSSCSLSKSSSRRRSRQRPRRARLGGGGGGGALWRSPELATRNRDLGVLVLECSHFASCSSGTLCAQGGGWARAALQRRSCPARTRDRPRHAPAGHHHVRRSAHARRTKGGKVRRTFRHRSAATITAMSADSNVRHMHICRAVYCSWTAP